MSTYGRKTLVMEHWFGIDSVLFGESAKECLTEDEFSRYCVTKGAFLVNLYEIYMRLGYDPDMGKPKSGAQLQIASNKLAEQALTFANKVLKSQNVGALVKEEIQEAGHLEGLEEKEVARYVVKKRRNAVAIDALTMSYAVQESGVKISDEDWHGKVLLDSHKTMRDTLIDISLG